jgi:hypothetical protein
MKEYFFSSGKLQVMEHKTSVFGPATLRKPSVEKHCRCGNDSCFTVALRFCGLRLGGAVNLPCSWYANKAFYF